MRGKGFLTVSRNTIHVFASIIILSAATAAHAHPYHDDGAMMPGDPECYDFDQSPIQLAPGFDVSKVLEGAKKYKNTYLDFRCNGMLRFVTDPFFSDFEKDGLTISEIHEKLGELIKVAGAIPLVTADMITQLKTAQEIIAEAKKAPGVAGIRVRCRPNCQNKTVQCSMKSPDTDWVDLPEF
jgi:hypothetical protein